MSFDYKYTCPEINQLIKDAESTIKCKIDDIIEELCPMIEVDVKDSLTNQWSEQLYKELESIFEDTRDTNEKMRNAAEKQVDVLESEVERLREELREKESKIEELNKNVSTLEDMIWDLEHQ